MAMLSKYSESLRARMVHRMRGPEGASASSLSQEVGIPQTTLSLWARQSGRMASMKRITHSTDKRAEAPGSSENRQRRPEDWSPTEKLAAVLEASQIEDATLGQWLRSKGLHEAHLRQWRDTAMTAAKEALGGSKEKGSTAQSKRVKDLERELRRKDKALAETAALLVLRKKADALWGDEDDSTGQTNDDES